MLFGVYFKDMKKLEPYPQELTDLFAQLDEAGETLDYVIFELGPDEQPDYTAINTEAMKVVYPKASINTAKMMSEVVTPEHFMGPYYDWKAKKLIVRATGNVNGNYPAASEPTKYFYYDQPIEPQNELPLKDEDLRWPEYNEFHAQGYAHALSDPPYGARTGQMGKLLEALNTELFSDFQAVEIRQWSTDWADEYFNFGKEWWGAYWWTVYNKVKNWVIVIGASTTD